MSHAIELVGVNKLFRHRKPATTFQETVLGRGRQKTGPDGLYWALHDVTFAVREGEMLGIVGANGAGKTTLMRLICGIGRPDSGTITVNGRMVALLDLGSNFHPELTGRENVFVSGIVSGLTRREVARRFDEIVAFSELHEFIDDPLRTYSSGMRMRLAFAVTVAIRSEAEILLVDEVLAVGDASFQEKCLARIDDFRAKGMTILLISHDLQSLRTSCDEVIWLRAGQIASRGTPDEVLERYRSGIGDETASQRPVPAPALKSRSRWSRFGRAGG